MTPRISSRPAIATTSPLKSVDFRHTPCPKPSRLGVKSLLLVGQAFVLFRKHAAPWERLLVPVELSVDVVVGEFDPVQPLAVRRAPLQQIDRTMGGASRRDMQLRRRDHSRPPTETRS